MFMLHAHVTPKSIKFFTHVKKVGHTPEFVWHLLMNLKNNYLLKKLLKWANKKCEHLNIYKNKKIIIKIKKNTWIYHYFIPVHQQYS